MQTQWTDSYIEVNGGQMHYTRTGKGDKQSLVLVHGRSDNGLCWAKTAKNLEKQYDIIMPDSRGHGLSARLHPGDVLDNTGDLASLIQILNLDHPIVAGHSMGASSASELGARFPELTRALILEDPPWGMFRSHASNKKGKVAVDPFAEWMRSLAGKSLEQVMAECKPDYPKWEDDVLKAWCQGKMQLDPNFMTVKRMPRMDWQEIARAIRCPTLLITAVSPRGIVTPEIATKVVDMNAHIQHVSISGTGHHIRFENYEDYYQALTAFLSKLI